MEYGLIGEHLSHSFSKMIHERVASYQYELHEVAKDDLHSFMMNKEFKAINVTIPYKQDVIPYLDELSPLAKDIGAVNCITNKNGYLKGYNTDVLGFIELVKYSNIDVKNKNALVLGNGGASKAIQAGLKQLGIKSILIASILNEEGTIPYEDIYLHQEIEIIVNTTPVGMYPNNNNKIIDVSKFNKLEGFIDVIYNPINTVTVLEATEKGIKAIGGLYMLVAQAVKAIEIFLDTKIEDNVISKIYNEIKNDNSNIVLIGMPSSGKSAIGKLIAEKLNLEFIDTDEYIINKIQMPIKDYFAKYGEDKFRELEHLVVEEIYKYTPKVISTGGGIIKNKSNIDLLKQNGIIYFINRPLDKLFPSNDRPLSSNKDDLINLYNTRLPLYKRYSDIEINNDDDINKAYLEILKRR